MKVENTPRERIAAIVAGQKEYFRSGVTLDIAFRRRMLQRLSEALVKWEKPLCDALYEDLHKSYEEAYMTELLQPRFATICAICARGAVPCAARRRSRCSRRAAASSASRWVRP